jgi:hypothetical protein
VLTVLIDVMLIRRKARIAQRRAQAAATAGPEPAHPPNNSVKPKSATPEDVMGAT